MFTITITQEIWTPEDLDIGEPSQVNGDVGIFHRDSREEVREFLTEKNFNEPEEGTSWWERSDFDIETGERIIEHAHVHERGTQ